jgi:hypothetical protein
MFCFQCQETANFSALSLLESVFRAIVNRSRACPPLFWRAGLLTISQPHHSHEGDSRFEDRA